MVNDTKKSKSKNTPLDQEIPFGGWSSDNVGSTSNDDNAQTDSVEETAPAPVKKEETGIRSFSDAFGKNAGDKPIELPPAEEVLDPDELSNTGGAKRPSIAVPKATTQESDELESTDEEWSTQKEEEEEEEKEVDPFAWSQEDIPADNTPRTRRREMGEDAGWMAPTTDLSQFEESSYDYSKEEKEEEIIPTVNPFTFNKKEEWQAPPMSVEDLMDNDTDVGAELQNDSNSNQKNNAETLSPFNFVTLGKTQANTEQPQQQATIAQPPITDPIVPQENASQPDIIPDADIAPPQPESLPEPAQQAENYSDDFGEESLQAGESQSELQPETPSSAHDIFSQGNPPEADTNTIATPEETAFAQPQTSSPAAIEETPAQTPESTSGFGKSTKTSTPPIEEKTPSSSEIISDNIPPAPLPEDTHMEGTASVEAPVATNPIVEKAPDAAPATNYTPYTASQALSDEPEDNAPKAVVTSVDGSQRTAMAEELNMPKYDPDAASSSPQPDRTPAIASEPEPQPKAVETQDSSAASPLTASQDNINTGGQEAALAEENAPAAFNNPFVASTPAEPAFVPSIEADDAIDTTQGAMSAHQPAKQPEVADIFGQTTETPSATETPAAATAPAGQDDWMANESSRHPSTPPIESPVEAVDDPFQEATHEQPAPDSQSYDQGQSDQAASDIFSTDQASPEEPAQEELATPAPPPMAVPITNNDAGQPPAGGMDINHILQEHINWLHSNGRDGRRANFRNADLQGYNLTNLQLTEASFRGANLSNASLSGSDLRGADLSEAIFENTDLRNANLASAVMNSADLRSSHLAGADLQSADLSSAVMAGMILSGINFAAAILQDTNLESANLTQANMQGANLRGAQLSAANLTAANLAQANCRDVRFDQAIMDNVALTGTNMKNASMAGASLAGVDIAAAEETSQELRQESLHAEKNLIQQEWARVKTYEDQVKQLQSQIQQREMTLQTDRANIERAKRDIADQYQGVEALMQKTHEVMQRHRVHDKLFKYFGIMWFVFTILAFVSIMMFVQAIDIADLNWLALSIVVGGCGLIMGLFIATSIRSIKLSNNLKKLLDVYEQQLPNSDNTGH